MFSSTRLAANRTSRELAREIRRHISKTSSVPNSDAITRQQDNKLKINADVTDDKIHSRWVKLSKHNNTRALSTIQTKANPQSSNAQFFSKEESREFMAIFPDIVRDLTDAGRHTDIPEVTKRFAKVLQYNVPTGKKIRGLSTVVAYKMLEKPENLTPENLWLANVLGWCVEMLQGFEIVNDDLEDNREMRHDAPCWYRNQDVGLKAFNDGIFLENSVYCILRKYFASLPSYIPITELFHDVTFETSMGKSFEYLLVNNGAPYLDQFTMKNYKLLIKYKKGYYTFHLPVALAMFYANIFDAEQHRQAKTILMEIAEFFQIQKDFINCFGNGEKIGSDIKEGRCSWLAVVALQRANGNQRKILEKFYGTSTDEAVEKVKNVYEQLSLPTTYAAYEAESSKIIQTHIQQISKGLPHNLFFILMEQLYNNYEYDY